MPLKKYEIHKLWSCSTHLPIVDIYDKYLTSKEDKTYFKGIQMTKYCYVVKFYKEDDEYITSCLSYVPDDILNDTLLNLYLGVIIFDEDNNLSLHTQTEFIDKYYKQMIKL